MGARRNLIAAAGAAVCLLAYARWQKHGCLPKRFRRRRVPATIGPREDCRRDGYTKKKVPAELDVIVIGSGIAGLTCAGYLARAGQRVLVLEQHYIAGGCTHTFEEGGVEFDTGVHYVGNIAKRRKYLNLITDTPVEWDQLGTAENGWVYDEVRIGSGSSRRAFDYPAGEAALRAEMLRQFPEEGPAIDEYLRLIKAVSKKDFVFDLKVLAPWLAALLYRLLTLWPDRDGLEVMLKRSAKDVVSELTQNVELQAVMLAQFGDHGLPPSEASFFLHAQVAAHYLNGGWYPHGGTGELAKHIIPTIEAAGGRVLVRKGVKQILLTERGSNVRGVEMANGDVILAPRVVAACGAAQLYKSLLPDPDPRCIRALDAVGPSCTLVYAFVALRGSPTELQLRSANIWSWPDADYDKMTSAFMADPSAAPIPMFIGFPCAKDKTWEARYPGVANAVIMTLASHEWFKKWEGTRLGHRGADYDALKEMFRDRILEGLFEHYPQCRGRVTHTSVGTSLSFNHYLGVRSGEVYGLGSTGDRYNPTGDIAPWLRPQVPGVSGLYQTGVDTLMIGFTAGAMSGVLTAHKVLGYGTLGDLLTGRNLIYDLWHLDKQEKGITWHLDGSWTSDPARAEQNGHKEQNGHARNGHKQNGHKQNGHKQNGHMQNGH